MATFEVDIDDDLVAVLKRHLPPGWTVSDWLALKGEQAIAQVHLDQRQQAIAADAADSPLTPPADDATQAAVTNDDVQQDRQRGQQDAADD